MKPTFILLATSALAIPFSDQLDASGHSDTVQTTDKLQELVSRIKEVSNGITAGPAAATTEVAGGPQPPPGDSESEYIVGVLESVEASISGLIEYLGGHTGVNPGSLPPVTSTPAPTASVSSQTMLPASSGLPPSSSMGTNTTYTPPPLSSPGVSSSALPPFSNTTTILSSTPAPTMNGTSQTPPPTLNTSSPTPVQSMNVTSQTPPPIFNSTSTPVPPSSTFSMAPVPSNVTITPTGGVPTLNFTTLMPIPVPSSTATSSSVPSAIAAADQQIESFLQWLLDFLEAQLQSAGSLKFGRAQ